MLRNILGVVAGLIVGSVVNMALILISGSIISPPDGADLTTMEGLLEAMPNMEPKHFLMPFLAHALGTFTGALLAVAIGKSHHLRLVLIIGVFFLIGGIINVFSLPSPVWFILVDLALAYIPMALLAYKLIGKKA